LVVDPAQSALKRTAVLSGVTVKYGSSLKPLLSLSEYISVVLPLVDVGSVIFHFFKSSILSGVSPVDVLVGAFVDAVVGTVVGTLVGAVVGAFVGAVVGALVGALVGAVVGALVGALVGAVVGSFVGANVFAGIGVFSGVEAFVGANVGAFVGANISTVSGVLFSYTIGGFGFGLTNKPKKCLNILLRKFINPLIISIKKVSIEEEVDLL
jgi:hypothetical protein